MTEPLTHAECEHEIRRLRFLNQQLVGRLAAACEVLCKRANGLPCECPECGARLQWTVDAEEYAA